MSQAPLPPHERTWRHPSELAAAEREAFRSEEVSPTTRALAVVTGTLGLLAVGILVLTAAPGRQASPVAVGATTTPVAIDAVVRSGIAAIGRFASDDDGGGVPVPPAQVAPALATPVGDGRSAVMTRLSTAGSAGDALAVQLTSGPVVTAEIVEETVGGVVVVTIDERDPGHEIAAAMPEPGDMVTVMVDPPVTVALADIASVGAVEGTPVLDARGHLVGLCTRGTDGTPGIVGVAAQPAPASTAPATAPPSGPPVSAAPAASATTGAP